MLTVGLHLGQNLAKPGPPKLSTHSSSFRFVTPGGRQRRLTMRLVTLASRERVNNNMPPYRLPGPMVSITNRQNGGRVLISTLGKTITHEGHPER